MHSSKVFYYIKMPCPFVCVVVSVPTFFSTRPSNCKQIWHACADRSGNHSSPNKFDPPNPKGVSGGFYGVNNSKVHEMIELPRKSIKKLTPTPRVGWVGGSFWGQKLGKYHELTGKLIHFVTPHPHPPGRGSFMGHNFSIKFWKVGPISGM